MNDMNARRRSMLGGAAALPLAMVAVAGSAEAATEPKGGAARMTSSFVRTKDGVDIF
jgi:non-heme chloroperoxidase